MMMSKAWLQTTILSKFTPAHTMVGEPKETGVLVGCTVSLAFTCEQNVMPAADCLRKWLCINVGGEAKSSGIAGRHSKKSEPVTCDSANVS